MSAFPHILIRASAGTGKTFQLSNRYLGLLYQGVPPDQILATTFTRKAAGEILDRVILRLAEAALDPERRRDLAGFLQLTQLSEKRCQAMLGQLIGHLHRLRIGTLDAFFAQLAGSFSLELGLPPGWHIVEEVHDQYLRREAIARTLRGDGTRVGHATREVERLVHLMAKGEAQRSVSELVRSTVSQLYDLYLETDAAAWQRVPQPRPLSQSQLDAALTALTEAVLPAHASIVKARNKDVETVGRGDWETFISGGIPAKILDGETVYYGKEIPAETVRVYQRLLSHARAVLLRQVAGQTEATFQLLDKFHTIYGDLKWRSRALRFEDVTRSLVQGGRDRQSQAEDALAGIHRRNFRLDTPVSHLLLDEFQDTSLVQWRVLGPFARHVTSTARAAGTGEQGPDRSFFCVGDVKQAIYGWRGGQAEIFEALQGAIPHLTDSSLTESFRSAPPVIDTVNRIFTNLTRHTQLDRLEQAVAQWCDRFKQHSTAKHHLPGYVELSTAAPIDEEETPEDATLRCAAERVRQLVRHAPGRSVGVLVRRNKVVAQLIYELRQLRVPASEEGGNPLTDSPAVQVVLSLLKFADHPGDTVARFHVAQSPLAARIEYPDHDNLTRTLEIADEVRVRLLHDGYGPSVQYWTRLIEPDCDQRDRSRLGQLVELAYRYDAIATLRPVDFLRYVEGERVADPTSAQVRVMTVHQSKGLQFDIVVLPELDVQLVGQAGACVVGQPAPMEPVNQVCLYRNANIQKLLPREQQVLFEQSTRRSVYEALCVLYVAVTRAIHALHMIIKPPAQNERTLPKTAAGLLRAALTDGAIAGPGETLFQTGDPRWCESVDADAADSVERPAVSAAPEIRLAADADPAEVLGESASPSAMEGGGRIDPARVLNLHSAQAMARGTLIHALFEQVAWLDESPPDPGHLREVLESHGDSSRDIESALAAFEQMLALPDVAAVLSRSFYEPPRDADLAEAIPRSLGDRARRAEVLNERRFAVRDQGRLLSGTIDRLVLLYDDARAVAADILDYKTDAVAPDTAANLDHLVAHYQPQIEAYRRAVAAMFRLDRTRIAARLVFVSPGVVRAVPAPR